MPSHVRGIALAVAGVLVISPDALIVRALGTDTWTTVAWRGALTALGLLATFLVRRPGRHPAVRISGRAAAIAAGLFAAASVAFVSALNRTDAASVLAIVATGPLIAAALARGILGDRTPARTWVAAGAVVLGLAAILAADGVRGQLDGSLLALVGASSFAGFLTVARASRPADMTPVLAMGGALAAIIGVVAGADLTIRAGDLALVATLGLVILPASLLLIARATHHLPAPEVGLILLLETVLGPLWVWLALGERPDPRVVGAAGLIVATVALHALAALRAALAEPVAS